MKNQIISNMIDLMNKYNRKIVWYGDLDLIEECAKLSGVVKSHPQNTIQYILNTLDKSDLFIKGYIRADFNGRIKRYRSFKLKTEGEL